MWGDIEPMVSSRPPHVDGNVFNNEVLTLEEVKFKKALYYWNNQFQFLMGPEIIIFSAIKNFKFFTIDIQEILKQLINLNLINNVEALYQLSNPSFYYIQFSSPLEAATFQNISHQINGNNLHFLSQQDENRIIKIVIEKLPVNTLREYIPHLLEQWGKIELIIPSNLSKPNGKPCATGQTVIHFKLKNDCTIMDIPYFIKIKHLRVYLHIASRPRICFRCESNDHLISECPMKFCSICRGLRPFQHACRQSYASKLSSRSKDWSSILQQLQEDANLLNFANSLSHQQKENYECNQSLNQHTTSDQLEILETPSNSFKTSFSSVIPSLQTEKLDSTSLDSPNSSQIDISQPSTQVQDPPQIQAIVNPVVTTPNNSSQNKSDNHSLGKKSRSKSSKHKPPKKPCRETTQEGLKTYSLRKPSIDKPLSENKGRDSKPKKHQTHALSSSSNYDTSLSSEDDNSKMDEGGDRPTTELQP